MLMQIHIMNLITIQELHLDFKSGTTVVTGETGAGKSILIDAINLALGERAMNDIVRQGQEKADISLCFDISKLHDAKNWLKTYDLDNNVNECIIRRTINKDGRSRSFINGLPTTLQPLRELSELLINIHGQHEHQALIKSEIQRNMLDSFAGHDDLVDKVKVLAEEWQTLSKEVSQLQKLSNERTQRIEFLKFQLRELDELNTTSNEFDSLDLEHKQLAHSDELLQNINHALGCLSANEEQNAVQLLHQSIQALESVQRVDPKIATWIESIKNAIISISDAEDELNRYLEAVDLDPQRLNWIEQRISKLFDTARKYKIAPQELFEFQQNLSLELSELENSDERLSELNTKLSRIAENYHAFANKLSLSRKKSAKKLAIQITETIRELALPHGEFEVHFEPENNLSFHGLEKIIFQIKTNAGHGLQPLSKIASGGELSRISLAIHLATAEKHTTPTLIFDEVDVGIGGGTAEIVGKLLRRLGDSHQVLCITHSPQVAAKGHQHLKVEKITQQNCTYSRIKSLIQQEKIDELARMLGGVEITKKTLAHAKEMLEKV